MVYNELPIACPVYDDLRLQTRFRENCQGNNVLPLIAPRDAVLPFQFRIPTTTDAPVSWQIMCREGGLMVDISLNITTALKVRTVEEWDYYTYTGGVLQEPGPTTLSLPPGNYYWQLYVGDTPYFSEEFRVPDDHFSATDVAPDDYMVLKWWNSCDIRPIYYGQDFVNVLYLDTMIISSEPEIIEETEENGNGEAVPTFQRVVIPHRIEIVVPDFLKKALCVMAIHGEIELIEKAGRRQGKIVRPAIASTTQPPGCYSTVEIRFQEETAITKAGCCDNMVAVPCVGEVTLADAFLETDGSVYLLGSAPSGTQVDVYGSETMDGEYTLILANQPAADLNTGGLLIPAVTVGVNLWFKVSAHSLKCSYPMSGAVTSEPSTFTLSWDASGLQGNSGQKIRYKVNSDLAFTGIDFIAEPVGSRSYPEGTLLSQITMYGSNNPTAGVDFEYSTGFFKRQDGTVTRTWRHVAGVDGNLIGTPYGQQVLTIGSMNQNYTYELSSELLEGVVAQITNSTTIPVTFNVLNTGTVFAAAGSPVSMRVPPVSTVRVSATFTGAPGPIRLAIFIAGIMRYNAIYTSGTELLTNFTGSVTGDDLTVTFTEE
jgi:hypothetical protein